MDNSISIESLKNGEKVALGVLAVTSIPHASSIDSNASSDEIMVRYKSETVRLFSEIFQQYKADSMTNGAPVDVCFELLWSTAKVENQPYNAKISLHIIIRAIHRHEERVRSLVETFSRLILSTLSLQKYEIHRVPYTALVQVIRSIDDQCIRATIKEERIENLQNQMVPFCYSYGRIPNTQNDFSGLVDVLTNYPDAAVSIQIIPTMLTNQEVSNLDFIAQNLEMLSHGAMNQGMMGMGCSFAERYAKDYRYYSDHKSSALFLFTILAYGNAEATAAITNKLYGQLSSSCEAAAAIKTVNLTRNEVRKDANFYPLPWAVNEILINKGRNPQIWKSRYVSKALYRLPYIITGEEAAEVFRLPIGSERVAAGLNINESDRQVKTYSSNIINAGDISIGKLKSSPNNDVIGFSLNDLTKHMLVVGTPGSGKTTFSISLLDRLWKDHRIPFLVIEPAKNEYRALVQSIPDLQVFTPGKNFISPFIYNPFVPPKNVKLEAYKSTLKTSFSAAVSMTTPLDKIFEDAINNCYSKFRWVDTYTTDDGGQIFNISDFIKCFEETFAAIGYTGDARNIGRAGVVRLNSLANLFDNYFSIPIEDLLKKPTVIELAAIENEDRKALIIALLLLSILAYVNANYLGEGTLRNVILIEEAHVLLDTASDQGRSETNPSAIAQSLVKRMLAEIRSYGVGMIIADQSPRKVSADVVALTDMKMVFRLVEGSDRQIIADSTNMSDSQAQRMSKLRSGEAFLFFSKLDKPEEVITPDYRLDHDISVTISDAEIHERSTYWIDKGVQLRPYPQCSLCRDCSSTCDYNRRVLGREIAQRIFAAHFTPDMNDFETVKEVFGQISRLTTAELNNEKLTHALLSCVKVHLWRKIRYGTRIPVRDVQIENSLKK
jgi:hypothetical protein